MRAHAVTGFTLVELLVVIAITAILASITIPVFMNMERTQRQQVCMASMRQLGVALTEFYQDNKFYPKGPRPDYLEDTWGQTTWRPDTTSGNPNYWQEMPFSTAPSTLPAGWREWELIPSPSHIIGAMQTSAVAAVGGSTLQMQNVSPMTTTSPLVMYLVDPVSQNYEQVTVTTYTVTPPTVSLQFPLTKPVYNPGSYLFFVNDGLPHAADPGATSLWVDNPGPLPQSQPPWLVVLGNGEAADITSIDPPIVPALPWPMRHVTVNTPLRRSYASGAGIDFGYKFVNVPDPTNPRWNLTVTGQLNPPKGKSGAGHLNVGNFGLATLYYQYLNDTSNYGRSADIYHCPVFTGTANVNRNASVQLINDSHRNYDPLWNGYNSYDITYNYDQFYTEIMAFEANMGTYTSAQSKCLQLPRQLNLPELNAIDPVRFPHRNPPADTVVCWCPGHHDTGAEPGGYLLTPDGSALEEPVNVANAADAAALQQRFDGKVDVVLWLDGSVNPIHPRLVLSPSDNHYYWWPTVLSSSGDVR